MFYYGILYGYLETCIDKLSAGHKNIRKWHGGRLPNSERLPNWQGVRVRAALKSNFSVIL